MNAKEILKHLEQMRKDGLTVDQVDALAHAANRVQSFGDEAWITAASVNENTRRIDVALNGNDAAPQAMLCDVVSQIEAMQRSVGVPLVYVTKSPGRDYYSVEFATRDEHGDVTVHRRSRKSYPEWLSECEWAR